VAPPEARPIRFPLPIRVLHLTRWLHPVGGGIRTYLAQAAAALDPAVVEFQAAALEAGVAPAYLPRVRYLGRPGDSRPVAMLRFWGWLRHALAEVDVVHIHGVFNPLLPSGALACRRRGVPYVVSPHGALEPWGLNQRRAAKQLFLGVGGRRLLRRSSAVLASTPANAEAIRSTDPRLPVRVVLPGVAVADRPTVDFLREEFSSTLRILYLGRFEPVKGIDVLLDALRRLRADGSEAQLDVVGWGDAAYTARLKAGVLEHGLEGHVVFHGFLDGAEKLRRLRAAHVLAVPSHSENFSFAAAEALAVGLPVVATANVALAPWLRRYDCGTVVPVADPAALAGALARYRDPALRRAQAGHAHACAGRELSQEVMGRGLQDVYRDAVRLRAATAG